MALVENLAERNIDAILSILTDVQQRYRLNEDIYKEANDEIQDILGIGRTSAYNLIHKNLFHCVRIGGSIRISKKSFDAWLEGQDGDCE